MIHSLNQELKQLQVLPVTYERLNKIKDLNEELNQVLENEEIFWIQRSRVSWLREWDMNTPYFHVQALKRKLKNVIKGL